MIEFVFFLEELSAKVLLEGLLPRIFPERQFRSEYIVFEGKQDLKKRLRKRLQGWVTEASRFIVLCDQDSSNCTILKNDLVSCCSVRNNVLIRIACHELESWYLGDLKAVEQALNIKGISKNQNKANYRDPDRLGNPVQELDKLTKNLYQKVSSSREIGRFLDIDNNRSGSFKAFISGVRRLAESAEFVN